MTPAARTSYLFIVGMFVLVAATHLATPLVAGIAALVRSQHASWSPAQIKAAIERGADQLPGDTSRVGHGRVNAAGALGLAR